MYNNSLYLRDRHKQTFFRNYTLRMSINMNVRIFQAHNRASLISAKYYTP
jgi:hypothetical protein